MEAQELLQAPNLLKCKKILIVQPHPDDNEIGMGATIAKLTASGAEVIYLTVTNGDLGSNDKRYSYTDVVRIRTEETEKAGRCLGVREFYCLNLPDGGPHNHYELTVMIGSTLAGI